MTITTNPTLFNLDRITWVTASVVTASASRYVVIVRPTFATVILTHTTGERYDWQPQVGDTNTGDAIRVENGCLHLVKNDGSVVLRTSPLQRVDVHEN